jgi:hypothetical protein
MRALVACRLPRVREVAVVPLDTAVSAPAPRAVGFEQVVVPGFHGGMLDDATTASVVRRVVAGRPVARDDGWAFAEDVIQAGASAWQVPQLDAAVNAEWDDEPTSACRAVRANLQRTYGGTTAP